MIGAARAVAIGAAGVLASGGGASVTAKSVVFDIASNHGDGTYMEVRRIKFFSSGDLIELVPDDYTVYKSSQLALSKPAENVFDTSQDDTGTNYMVSFIFNDGQISNNRVVVVFDTPQTFDEIKIVNGHQFGGATTRGWKNLKVQYTDDTYTTTTFNAAVTNGNLLFHVDCPEQNADDRQVTIWKAETSGISPILHEIALDSLIWAPQVEGSLAGTIQAGGGQNTNNEVHGVKGIRFHSTSSNAEIARSWDLGSDHGDTYTFFVAINGTGHDATYSGRQRLKTVADPTDWYDANSDNAYMSLSGSTIPAFRLNAVTGYIATDAAYRLSDNYDRTGDLYWVLACMKVTPTLATLYTNDVNDVIETDDDPTGIGRYLRLGTNDRGQYSHLAKEIRAYEGALSNEEIRAVFDAMKVNLFMEFEAASA